MATVERPAVSPALLGDRRPSLTPVSEHAEDDRSQESKGYDGSKHVEPRLQFHHCLLCWITPAGLAQVAPRQLTNLRARSVVDQRISMLRCNNSMVKSIVSIVQHLMMHKNNATSSLIQEILLGISHVFIYYY